MKKTLLLLTISLLTVVLVWCSTSETTTNTDTSNNNSTTTETNIEIASMKPESAMDIYGKIIATEGNEFTLLEVDTSKDPTFGMAPADKKAYMMNLSQEQRMALKDEIRNATLGNVKIMIPVWIPVIVKTASWPEAEEVMWSLADMTVGSYISVWYNQEVKDRNVAKYVKKSFTK